MQEPPEQPTDHPHRPAIAAGPLSAQAADDVAIPLALVTGIISLILIILPLITRDFGGANLGLILNNPGLIGLGYLGLLALALFTIVRGHIENLLYATPEKPGLHGMAQAGLALGYITFLYLLWWLARL